MAPVNAASVTTGVWGAEHAVLTVSAAQSRIESGAAETIISGPIKTDAKGRFKATGRYHAFAPGPDRIDLKPVLRDAHIEGRVVGNIIEMVMHVAGDKTAQRYMFTKGQRTKLHRML